MTAMTATFISTLAGNKLTMVVGTYTDAGSRGIYSYMFDQQKGTATPLDTLDLQNPSFLTIARDGYHIYAVTENHDTTAAVNAIDFDPKSGHMKVLNSQPTHGLDPCYVDTDGHLVLTANYSSGSMSVFPLSSDGRLLPMTQQFKGSVTTTNVAQLQSPHIHCTRFLPDGKTVLATDFSGNRVLRFLIDENGQLKPDGVAAQLSHDSGVRHFVWSNNRKYLYVMSEVSGAVSVFRDNRIETAKRSLEKKKSLSDGHAVTEMQRIQEIQSDSVGGHGGADIHLSPDGKFLYASNRLKADGISIFKVNQKTGRLTKVGYQLTGIHPRNFRITPNGRYLLCACRDSNHIRVYRINRKTGLLTDTHQDIVLSKPVCIRFCQL